MQKYFMAALALLVNTSLHAAPQAQALRITEGSQLQIKTPALAQRRTSKLRLSNGMQVLLVSDPGATQAAAAVAVRAGTWQDPPEAPGLSHFLEHMLFMGSAHFPQEDGFSKYLASYNGTANATTGLDRTVYMMQLNSDGLSEALLRLADFFVAPLLRDEALARERQAIDQELRGAANSDSRREQMVRARLSDPNHPHVYSSNGTSAMLARIESTQLRSWFENNYDADRMALVIYAPLDLRTLEDVTVRAFAAVPSRNLPGPHIDAPLLRTDLEGHLVYIEPVASVSRHLLLQWDIPYTLGNDRGGWPAELTGYTLSQAGSGSLAASLRDAGWIDDLYAYPARQSTGSAQMLVQIALTDAGVLHYHEVLHRVFAALAQLRRSGIDEAVWQQMRGQNLRDYAYQERDYSLWTVHDIAHRLADSPLATFPDPLVLPATYDATKVHAVLDRLSAKRCHYILMAPAALAGLHGDITEAEMGARFTVRAISTSMLAGLEGEAPAHYTWVTPNPYLPRTLAVFPVDKQTPTLAHPAHAADDAQFTLLWARDVDALTPHVAWRFVIKTPALRDASARNLALAALYVSMVNRALAEADENASQAGMSFDVRALDTGIQLNISGYHEGALRLLADVVAALRETQRNIDDVGFARAKVRLQRMYEARGKNNPFDDLSDIEQSITHLHPVPREARAAALATLTTADLQAFGRTMLASVHVQGSMVGNMDAALASQAHTVLMNGLQAQPYADGKLVHPRLRNMLDLTSPVVVRRSTAAPSSLVSVSLYAGKETPKNYVASQVLQQFLSSRFFDALRTKQQTGYLVQSGADTNEGHVLYEFLVQPEHHSVEEVLQRIESFVSHTADNPLDALEFAQIRASVLHELRAPPSTVGACASRLYDLAFRRHGNFAFYEDAARALESLTYDEFKEWNDALLDPDNPHRVVILMKGSRDITGRRPQ